MKKRLVFLLGAILIPFTALAEGTVLFTPDVLPLLKDKPSIVEPVLQQVEVDEAGKGVRLGPEVAPRLAGRRVSPYVFSAIRRDTTQARYKLTVFTNVDFFDDQGKIVYRLVDGMPIGEDSGLYRAVRFEEKFSSLSLTPAE